jgi:tetratricopeptide (TPR) repeat protein
VAAPVQHIDILPTVLDLVRAPVPPDLRGRSLRAALDGDERELRTEPIYAESLAALFRFGGPGKFSLADSDYRYIRIGGDGTPTLEAASTDAPLATRLSGELDQLLEGQRLQPPGEISPADEDLLAALGYLPGVPLVDTPPEPLGPEEEARVADMHRTAAVLTGQRDYMGAIARLRQIVATHPKLAVVQYQLGRLLGRVERFQDAERAFRAAARVEPDNPYIPMTLAGLLLRAGRPEDAWTHASLAVALAEHREDPRTRAAAHQVAARTALALSSHALAEVHAQAAEREDPAIPMRAFVRGRIALLEGRFDEARAAFEEAVATLGHQGRTVEDLHMHLGETLQHLELHAQAEEQYRLELRAFPHNLTPYVQLATLYHAADRVEDFEATVDSLLQSVTTPSGYDAAARLWAMAGDVERAAALRADARARFRVRPVRAPLEAGGPR